METPKLLLFFLCAAMFMRREAANGALAPIKTREMIDEANRKGPYLGLVIPNLFEMNPLLQSPHFKPTTIIAFSGEIARELLYISCFSLPKPLVVSLFFLLVGVDQGRRFRFGTIFQKQVILVMTGLGMVRTRNLLCFRWFLFLLHSWAAACFLAIWLFCNTDKCGHYYPDSSEFFQCWRSFCIMGQLPT